MLKVESTDRIKLIDPLFRASRNYWLAVIILASLVAVGVGLYIWQVSAGLVITGMDRPAYWGLYMVNFVFFIGVSLAGTLTSAILRITGVEWRRPITRLAETITVFALLIATLQIIIDMGRPDRLLYVVRYGRIQSPILWDVGIITTYLLCSLTYLYLPLIPDVALIRDNMPDDAQRWQRVFYTVLALGWRGNVEQWRRLEKVVGIMAFAIVPVGVGVHTITSWLLATTVQPGWHSTIFGPYFVVTAIFSGISALFLVMTVVRLSMGLENYITNKQYRGLSWLFITMAIIWGYFTYTEILTLVAGQQLLEFAVLESKLWGQSAPAFWIMFAFIGTGFAVMVISKIVPSSLWDVQILQPRYALAAAGIAVLLALVAADPQFASIDESSGILKFRAFVWSLTGLCATIAILGLGVFLGKNLVITAVIAGFGVVFGTWIERWNIIVPTVTHPRMIAWSTYEPTLPEIGLTVASVALFILLFVVFFKLFPAVSIWEVAEGRVIEEAEANVTIPKPEPAPPLTKSRWTFR